MVLVLNLRTARARARLVCLSLKIKSQISSGKSISTSGEPPGESRY